MKTNTQIRIAMFQAAAFIEAHPALFEFITNRKPDPVCNTPGCLLGWTGFFLGTDQYTHMRCSFTNATALDLGLLGLDHFLDRMTPIRDDNNWQFDGSEGAQNAAKVLRAYADQYHPEGAIPCPSID